MGIIDPKDYIIFKLTGQFVTEPLDASSTCLMDLNTLSWSDEILNITGLDKDKLPDIITSIAIAGKVTKEASLLTGLSEGTPVVCGGARNEIWQQILCDIFAIPVLVPNYLEEATFTLRIFAPMP